MIKRLFIASLAVVAGCQRVTSSPPAAKVDTTPALVDEATQIRNWNRTTCYYPDNATIAGPTGFWWQPKPSLPVWESNLVDVPLFLVNVGCMPAALIQVPPWTAVRWSDGTIPQTYSAAPPLPPSNYPGVSGEGQSGPTTIR